MRKCDAKTAQSFNASEIYRHIENSRADASLHAYQKTT